MKLVLIEDSELIRDQLLRLLATYPTIQVVGSAGDEDSAVDLISQKRPDMLLLDLALSPGSGLEVLRRIRAAGLATKTLVLSNDTSQPMRRACSKLGIEGFYDKSSEVSACLAHAALVSRALPVSHSQSKLS